VGGIGEERLAAVLGANLRVRGDADDDILLAGKALEKDAVGGEEEHEEGAALGGGGSLEVLRDAGVQGEDLASAAEAGDGRAWMIDGEIEDGDAVGELADPELGGVLEGRCLGGAPCDEVTELKGRGKLREATGGEGVVDCGEFLQEHGVGRSVADEMMEGEEE
jgi:hypothetical protein